MDIQRLRELEPIFGNWYVDGKIGEGRSSQVYRLRRSENDQLTYAVLKVLHMPQGKNDMANALSSGRYSSVREYLEAYCACVKAEAELIIKLKNNPNIVSVSNYTIMVDEDGNGFYLMLLRELLNPLSERLNADNASQGAVVRLGSDICHALEGIASAGICHGEIKPENIFVDANGCFKLGDLGFGRGFTEFSQEKGSSGYMAPEVYIGREPDIRADIYSLGLLMYKFLNHNRMPFLPSFPDSISFADREIAFEKRMKGETLTAPDCADEMVSSVILKACSFDAADRYDNPTEFAHELQLAAEGRLSIQTKPEYEPDIHTYTTPPAFAAVVAAERSQETEHTADNRNDPVGDETRVIPKLNEDSLNAAQRAGMHGAAQAYERGLPFGAPQRTSASPMASSPQNFRGDQPPEQTEEDETSKKSNGAAIAIIIILVLAIAAGGVWAVKHFLGGSSEDETTTVVTTSEPTTLAETFTLEKFTDMRYSDIQANTAYTDKYTFVVVEAPSETVEKGVVISQEPAAGAQVRRGAKITLKVSSGTNMVELVDVTGKTYSEAYVILVQAGFKVEQGNDRENDGTRVEGQVATMSGKIGERYEKDTLITLSLWGKAPTTTESTTQETTTQEETTQEETTTQHTTTTREETTAAKYFSIDDPQVRYFTDSDNSELSSVTVEFSLDNVSSVSVGKKEAIIMEKAGNGSVTQKVSVPVSVKTKGNTVICSLDLSEQEFTFSEQDFTYSVKLPQGSVSVDGAQNKSCEIEFA